MAPGVGEVGAPGAVVLEEADRESPVTAFAAERTMSRQSVPPPVEDEGREEELDELFESSAFDAMLRMRLRVLTGDLPSGNRFDSGGPS